MGGESHSSCVPVPRLPCLSVCVRGGQYTSVSMVEEKAAEGIKKLLNAEHKATETVAQAKQDKVAKLKMAKEEAEQEIATYKGQREQQFSVFSQERTGDSGSHKASTDKATKAELDAIAKQVAKNKGTMVDMLLSSVTTVA